jgi:hypothetical protein
MMAEQEKKNFFSEKKNKVDPLKNERVKGNGRSQEEGGPKKSSRVEHNLG